MMKKLLLADDSITIQKVVGIIFSTEEYQLETTDDGDSAFQKALAGHPDLVIADISMPGKDGFELCRAIKSEPSLSGTSVLLLPGAFDHFDEVKAAEVCADGWLTKPFESQALLDKVAQLLDAEPLQMAGVAAAEPAEVEDVTAAAEELSEDIAPVAAASAINDSVLGLDEVDELNPLEEASEESPDDIWDAVSFAEDELQQSEDETNPAASAAADVFGEETSLDAPTPDFSAAGIEEPVPPVVEDVPAFVVETPEPELTLDEQPEVESFVSSNEGPSSSDIEGVAAESVSEPDSVDFSAFTEVQEDFSDPSDSFVDEASPFIAEIAEDEPLDLVSSVEGPSGEVEASVTPDSAKFTEIEDLVVDAPLGLDDTDITDSEAVVDTPVEEETLELSTEDEVSELDVAEEPTPFVSEVVEEEALDLTEEDEVEEPEPFVPTEEVITPEADTIVDTAVEEIIEEPEEEILDLSADEIVEVEEGDVVAEESPLVGGESEVLEDEDIAELSEVVADDDIEVAEDIAVVEEVDDVEPLEEVAEGTPLEEVDEAPVVDESESTLAAEADEEEFFFDEPEDEVVEPAVAADTMLDDKVVESSVTEQVEQQLRELSEAELKGVVAKVAGPIIEKLAGEMLEQIAWDVVPDLAEAMINEEIRKIKEGTE